MKICSRCQIEKELSEFYKKKGTPDGLYYHCKACQNEYAKCHYSGNKDYYKTKARKWEKEQGPGFRHNLSEEEYTKLFGKFRGLCWICLKRKATDVDHDHNCCPSNKITCGRCVRGALCNRCNTGLGLFEDSKEYFQNALYYLDTP